MSHLFAAALPVLLGQSDRVRNFANELQRFRDQYDGLNDKTTVARHVVWLQPGPEGDTAIHVMDIEELSHLGRSFTASPYDEWWLDFLKDVHGVDLRNSPPPPAPELVFDSAS
jgi:hypothetical protein